MNVSDTNIKQTFFRNVNYLTVHQRWTLAILNLLLSVTNVSLNLIVIVGLWKTKQLHNIGMKLILMISIYDDGIGLVTNPLAALSFGWFYEQQYYHFQIVSETFVYLFPHASGFTLALIGYDRYIRIRHLSKCDQSIRLKKVNVIVFVIIPSITTLLGVMNVMGRVFSFNQVVKLTVLILDISVATLAIAIYLKTISFSHRRAKGLKRDANRESFSRIDGMIIRIFSVTLTSVCIFYFPYIVASVLNRLYPDNQTIMFYGYISGTIVFANSSANAIIFIMLNPKIRQLVYSDKKRSSLTTIPPCTITS